MKILDKLYNKALNHTTTKNIVYEKYIRWQFISFMDSVENGKYKIFKNILPFSLFLLKWISIFSFFILLGWSFNEKNVVELENQVKEKDVQINFFNEKERQYTLLFEDLKDEIHSISEYKRSPDWIKYKIYHEAKLENYQSIERLDDDILVFMWNEHKKYDIPTTIYFRLIEIESSFMWVNNKTSGAMGYMQVMPTTYNLFNKQLNLGKHDKINNIRVGTYMLYEHYNRWREMGFSDKLAWKYTLAEYNAGITKMQSEGGYYLPSYTWSYFNYILKYYDV